jgi:hypothetical protein
LAQHAAPNLVLGIDPVNEGSVGGDLLLDALHAQNFTCRTLGGLPGQLGQQLLPLAQQVVPLLEPCCR